MKHIKILSARQWNVLIKSGFVVAFGWFLVQRLNSQGDAEMLWTRFVDQFNTGSVWMLCLVIALMPLNWMLEVIKWRMLMRPAVVLSWRNAVLGILSGIAFSLFTPNRIGEYGGRILYVDPKYSWQTVLASLTGSFAQNVVHISLGLVAAVFLISSVVELPRITGTGLWVFSACIVVAIWLLYLNLPRITQVLERWDPPRFLHRPWKALGHVSQTTQGQLSQSLMFAMLRYLVFTIQYILLLLYFNVDAPFLWLAGGVAVIYLMQTSIPLPPFVDLIARNELGIILWAGFGANELSIIAAGLSIWIINLAFPALFGLLAVATVNVLRSLGYESEKIPSTCSQLPGSTVDGTTP
jgi:hypothetical protein